MKQTIVIAALSLVSAGTVRAQQYTFPHDTVQYDSENSYLMYFVRGGDTLGEPVTTHTRESQVGLQATGRVSVTLRSLDGGSFRRTDIYDVSPSGRVTAVNGTPVSSAPDARVDFLPRLPEPPVPLTVGTAWNDTVEVHGSRPYGQTFYTVRRAYSVTRVVDTLESRLALAVAAGTMQLRQGGWQDSTRGLVWWQEVAGPVVDSVWIDLRSGELVADFAIMDLTGRGGVGPKGSSDGMPSGLRSSVRRTRVRP